MKKILSGLLGIILSALIFLLLFSFYGKTVFSNLFTGIIGNLSSTVINTDFYDKNNKDDTNVKVEKNYTLGELLNSPEYEKLLNNKEVKRLIQKYVDITITGITDPDTLDSVDLRGDIIQFLKNNRDVLERDYNISINYEDIENIENDEDFKSINESFVDSVKDTSSELTSSQKNLIRMYNFVCGTIFKIILFILIIIDIVLISIIEKSFYKWIKYIGVNLISSGILTIIFGLLLHYSISNVVENHNLSIKANFLSVSGVGLFAAVVGGLLFILYFVIDRIVGKTSIDSLYEDVSLGYDKKERKKEKKNKYIVGGFDEKFEVFDDELSPDDE